MSELEKKAKTIKDLLEDYRDWQFLFRQGAHGNREAYNRARDTRHLFEKALWVPLEDTKNITEKLQELLAEMPTYDKDLDDVGGMYPIPVQMFGMKLEEWRNKVRKELL